MTLTFAEGYLLTFLLVMARAFAFLVIAALEWAAGQPTPVDVVHGHVAVVKRCRAKLRLHAFDLRGGGDDGRQP